MTAAMIISIIELVVKLEPEAVKLVNNFIGLFEGKTTAEQDALLQQTADALQPMVLKP
jgi:hypothetical protein